MKRALAKMVIQTFGSYHDFFINEQWYLFALTTLCQTIVFVQLPIHVRKATAAATAHASA